MRPAHARPATWPERSPRPPGRPPAVSCSASLPPVAPGPQRAHRCTRRGTRPTYVGRVAARRRSARRGPATASEPASKIEIDTELHEPRIEHRQRLTEHREARILGEDGVGVERVEEIEVQRHTRAREAQQLADAEVELIQPVA